MYAHFELVPDHLPDALKEGIAKFPPGALQFEIGIQSFNPEVQALVSRRQDNAKAADNIRWLCEQSNAHLHVDLIAGLPGEDVASFARGFDQLVALKPHEIQFGILKRLRGTPIIRHTAEFGMVFDPYPPYTILATERHRLRAPCSGWCASRATGTWWPTRAASSIRSRACWATRRSTTSWRSPTGSTASTDATHRIALDRLATLVSAMAAGARHGQGRGASRWSASDYAGRIDAPARKARSRRRPRRCARRATSPPEHG